MLKSICSRLNYREPLAEVSWKLEDNTDPDRRLIKIDSEDKKNGSVTELLCGEETGPGPYYIVVAVPEGVMSYH
jgi:hypothetical protein